eukprot:GSChrysophyteH1.ASY1.ANO1.2496.1 assembled CDS
MIRFARLRGRKRANLHRFAAFAALPSASFSGCSSSFDMSSSSITQHLESDSSRISAYWLEQLRKVERGVARDMICKLAPENVIGYQNPGSSMLQFVLNAKAEHPDKIIVLRCGDFYEVYGVDAVMFVAYAGLNPMRGPGIVRAGCPVANIQTTLDGLTAAGLTAAVYEEIQEPDVAPGRPAKRPRAKRRALSHVVSPGCTIYPYKLSLRPHDIDYALNKPYVGVHGTVSNGYNLVEVRVDEQSVTRYNRLSEEAVISLLSMTGYVEPIILQNGNALKKCLHFSSANSLSSAIDEVHGYNEQNFMSVVLKKVGMASGLNDADLHSFRHLNPGASASDKPRFIYHSTAGQIGLMPNPNIPDLVTSLLPASHYAHSARFLRKWLAMPPPRMIAASMRSMCKLLSESQHLTIPRTCQPFIVGKAMQLLQKKQCNAAIFRDIRNCAHEHEELVATLLTLTSHQTGMECLSEGLEDSVQSICSHIDAVIADDTHDDENRQDLDLLNELQSAKDREALKAFFAHNEVTFRGYITPMHPRLQEVYADLRNAARELVRHVIIDFKAPKAGKEPKAESGILSGEPSGEKTEMYFHPTDRRGQALHRRFTTANISDALQHYKALAAAATKEVESLLQQLCEDLMQYQIGIIHASNWALILQAVNAHTVAARRSGWCLAADISHSHTHTRHGLDLRGLSAWWMDRKDPATVTNDVSIHGMQLLTAPNMSGKSTVMRATLVAALLANAGLFVPCTSATVPQYDCFFLRATSFDVPSEGKSAFAIEMDDMAVLLRDSSAKSLVMIDEIGRGTSSSDGAALAGALLEHLAAKRVNGIFSTHLHEVLDLPLRIDSVEKKKMGFEVTIPSETGLSGGDRVKWTYKFEDGVCTDSMGLETARLYMVDPSVLNRASQLRTPAAGEPSLSPNLESLYAANAALYTQQRAEHHRLHEPNNQSLETVLTLVRDVFPSSTDFHDDIVIIESCDEPSAHFEGHSCVYLIHARKINTPDTFYVGETEVIASRLAHHKSSVRMRGADVRTALLKVSDKSTARLIEAKLIIALKNKGYFVTNSSDGSHRHFGSATIE